MIWLIIIDLVHDETDKLGRSWFNQRCRFERSDSSLNGGLKEKKLRATTRSKKLSIESKEIKSWIRD